MDQIRQVYGPRVATIVEAYTDTGEDPKLPWRPRKERHLKHLRASPDDVKLVAAADKLHNVRSILHDYAEIGDRIWERFNR